MNSQSLYGASATIDITPTEEVELGCAQGGEASWSIGDPVEMNFLALRSEGESPVILVSVDVLYVGPLLEGMIVESFRGLPRERVFIAATHTHAAPMTDPTKPMLGTPDPLYLAALPKRIQKVADYLMEDSSYRPVILKAAKGHGHHSINRRRWKKGESGQPGSMQLEPNPKGLTDETITVLEAVDEDGSLRAFVWNYACHPVAYPRGSTVSAHFPGVLRQQVRREQGRQVPVLFFQGFSGNIRPLFLTNFPALRVHVWTLLRKHRLAVPTWRPSKFESYSKWADSLAELTLRISGRSRQIKVQPPTVARVEMEGSLFVSPLPRPVVFQAIRIGEEFSMVGVSAEPVAEYAGMVRKDFQTRFTMPVGCLDTPFGYAPTQNMIAERGYESERFLEHFELEELNPDVQENMMKGFRAVR